MLCSVGGGRDGAALCHAFARARMPAGHRGILITGGQMPDADRNRIERIVAARDDLMVFPFVPEPIEVAARAAAIVGMGGYNTTSEMLSLDPPALIVPRVRPRREQLLRAERLAARGYLDMIHPDTLTPTALESWIADAVARRTPKRTRMEMAGLPRVRALADAAMHSPAASIRKFA